MKKLLTLFLIFTLSLIYAELVEAQLPETNISISLVKQTLGAATYDLGDLATHANINQWSKKKPVREHGSPDWWKYTATNIKYSILYSPLTNGLDDLVYTASSFWTYLQPRGDYSTYPLEGFRLGDFRGYEHTSIPAIITSNQPEGNVRNTTAVWSQLVNSSSAGITNSDLSISAYYYGILIEWGSSFENKHVQTRSAPLSSGASDIDFNYHLTPFSSSYTGTYRWTSFISSVEITNGEAERWQSLTAAQAEYSGEVIYITSDWSTYEKTGTFNNNIDIDPSSQTINVSWEWKSEGSITIDVTPENLPSTSVAGDTGDGIFITVILGATATGDFTLTIRASSENPNASPRSCKVTITDDWGEATPVVITITQIANPI